VRGHDEGGGIWEDLLSRSRTEELADRSQGAVSGVSKLSSFIEI
jgi:hypothetical protein